MLLSGGVTHQSPVHCWKFHHGAQPHFSLNLRWRALLKDAGMEPEHLLRQAGLPDDTFSDINRGLTTDEYLRFWRVLEKESDDQAFPLPFVERVSAEVFDPPLVSPPCVVPT